MVEHSTEQSLTIAAQRRPESELGGEWRVGETREGGSAHPTCFRDRRVRAQPSTAMSCVAANSTNTKNTAVTLAMSARCNASSAHAAPNSITTALASWMGTYKIHPPISHAPSTPTKSPLHIHMCTMQPLISIKINFPYVKASEPKKRIQRTWVHLGHEREVRSYIKSVQGLVPEAIR